MATRQLVVLWIGVMAGIGMFLFPPKYFAGGGDLGYRPLWVVTETVPKYSPVDNWPLEYLASIRNKTVAELREETVEREVRADYRRLTFQFVLLAAVTTALLLTLRPRQT